MKTISDLIKKYLSKVKDDHSLESQLEYYENLKIIDEAIIAACDRGKYVVNGKVYHSNHFNRRTKKTMKDIETELLKNKVDISSCKTFDELIELLFKLTKDTLGAGTLTIYDIALRIGAFLRLYPTKVFLHAGAEVGARKLGVNLKKGSKSVNKAVFVAIDSAFKELDCKQIENFLCIYKDSLYNPNSISIRNVDYEVANYAKLRSKC